MSEFDADYAAQLDLLAEELERLARRLGGLSPAAWRSRVEVVRAVLTDLVAIEAEVRGASPRDLPGIAEHALADAVVVIGGDVIEALGGRESDERVVEALSAVRDALAATR